MTTSENSNSLSRDLLSAARYYLGGSTGLTIAALVVGAGLWFNWSWLVAAGIAPIIIAAAPCAAMCALGLCMGGKKHEAAETGDESVVSSLPSKKKNRAAGKTDKECC